MSQVRFLEAEVTDLRRRLSDAPTGSRGLELRLADAQRSLAAVTSQNERLAQTLREARDQIMKLKEEVDRLAQPPAGFGTFLSRNDDDSIDVYSTYGYFDPSAAADLHAVADRVEVTHPMTLLANFRARYAC